MVYTGRATNNKIARHWIDAIFELAERQADVQLVRFPDVLFYDNGDGNGTWEDFASGSDGRPKWHAERPKSRDWRPK